MLTVMNIFSKTCTKKLQIHQFYQSLAFPPCMSIFAPFCCFTYKLFSLPSLKVYNTLDKCRIFQSATSTSPSSFHIYSVTFSPDTNTHKDILGKVSEQDIASKVSDNTTFHCCIQLLLADRTHFAFLLVTGCDGKAQNAVQLGFCMLPIPLLPMLLQPPPSIKLLFIPGIIHNYMVSVSPCMQKSTHSSI